MYDCHNFSNSGLKCHMRISECPCNRIMMKKKYRFFDPFTGKAPLKILCNLMPSFVIKPIRMIILILLVKAVSVGYCLTGWIGTAVVRSFGRDSLCYGLVLLALCWYFTFGRFVKDTPKSYQHDTNVKINFINMPRIEQYKHV